MLEFGITCYNNSKVLGPDMAMLKVGRGGNGKITHHRDESFLEFVLLRTVLE